MSDFSRRKILSYLAAAAGTSAYAPSVLQAAAPRKKIGVALVGLGYYSRDLLAPALQLTQHCELRGIVTGTPSKIPVWQERYGIPDKNVYSYETMHQLKNNDDIDVVYVVTPTSTHLQFTNIGATAGKHVWCEKPMAMTVQQCQLMIDVCRRNNVQLTISYRMQHEKNTQEIIGYATSQPFGKIQSVLAQAGYPGDAPPPGNWRLDPHMGGGALYDMGVYPMNAARYATQKMPIAVKARHEVERKDIFKYVDETSYFTLDFGEGLKAECATSVGKSMNQLKVTCEKGWYELAPMQSYSGVKGKLSTGQVLTPMQRNQQAVQMDNDALSILENRPILVPGEDGMRDIAIVEAAKRSAATKSEWVKIAQI